MPRFSNRESWGTSESSRKRHLKKLRHAAQQYASKVKWVVDEESPNKLVLRRVTGSVARRAARRDLLDQALDTHCNCLVPTSTLGYD